MLFDIDIKACLLDRSIIIDPLDDVEGQVQPCSVDLRVGPDFARFDHRIEPIRAGADMRHRMEHVRVDKEFVLGPGEFALGSTIEVIELGSGIAGIVHGRSSMGRIGLAVHVTAGLIDPGFRGQITLELKNENKVPILIPVGERICQVTFERAPRPAQRPYGVDRGSKYQDQRGATPAGQDRRKSPSGHFKIGDE